jgi:hypothetical protein
VSKKRGDREETGSYAPSDTLGYMNLAGVAIGLVELRGPMHLRACVSEECGDGEGLGSQTLSDTHRYRDINLVGWVIGLVVLRGPMHLRACVSEEGGDGEGAGSESISDTFRYINLTGVSIGLVSLRGPM